MTKLVITKLIMIYIKSASSHSQLTLLQFSHWYSCNHDWFEFWFNHQFSHDFVMPNTESASDNYTTIISMEWKTDNFHLATAVGYSVKNSFSTDKYVFSDLVTYSIFWLNRPCRCWNKKQRLHHNQSFHLCCPKFTNNSHRSVERKQVRSCILQTESF